MIVVKFIVLNNIDDSFAFTATSGVDDINDILCIRSKDGFTIVWLIKQET